MLLKKFAILIFLLNSVLFAQDSLLNNSISHIIKINSFPEGVKVYLNNIFYGITPMEIKDIPSGSYNIRMEGSNINTWEKRFIFNDKQDIEIYPILDGDYGMLRIVCDETNARVFINDSLVGLTPLPDIKLKLGIYNIRIEKKNFDLYKTQVGLVKYLSYLRRIDAKLISSYGYLTLKDTAKNKNIFIDGDKINQDKLNKLRLITGKHYLKYECISDKHTFNEIFKIKPDSNCEAIINHNSNTFTHFFQSFIIPGYGQFSDGSKLKGITIFGSTVLSALTFYVLNNKYHSDYNEYTSRRNDYLNAINEYEASYYKKLMLNSENEVNKAYKNRNISLGVFIGIYFINWLDALFNHSKEDNVIFIDNNSYVFGNSGSGLKAVISVPLNLFQ